MIKLFDLFIEAIDAMTVVVTDGELTAMFAELDAGEYENFLEWAAALLETIRILEAVLVFMLNCGR